MKKRLFLLLIIALTKSNLSAQTIFLIQDLDGFPPIVSDHELIFTSNLPSVTISGEIQSDISTTVTPTSDSAIMIKASEAVFGVNALGGSKGTVIRPKPRGIGGKNNITPKPKIDVKVYQINNDIHITSNETQIIGVAIYDLTGKLIISEKTTSLNEQIIATNGLKKSIYIIKIDFENQQYETIKFIKN